MNTLKPLHLNSKLEELVPDSRPVQTRLRLCIPKQYSQEPIISRLMTQHGLIVNIAAALLSASAHEAGWFDLELRGTNTQIRSALLYLNDLDLKVWCGEDTEETSW